MTTISVRAGRLLVPKKGWRIRACSCGKLFLLRVEDRRAQCYDCAPSDTRREREHGD